MVEEETDEVEETSDSRELLLLLLLPSEEALGLKLASVRPFSASVEDSSAAAAAAG